MSETNDKTEPDCEIPGPPDVPAREWSETLDVMEEFASGPAKSLEDVVFRGAELAHILRLMRAGVAYERLAKAADEVAETLEGSAYHWDHERAGLLRSAMLPPGSFLDSDAKPEPEPVFAGGQSAGAALGHLIPVDAYIKKSLRPDCRPDMLYRVTLPGGHAVWRGTIEEAREAILEHVRAADLVPGEGRDTDQG